MLKQFSLLLMLLISGVCCALAQTAQTYNAPVRWEKYKVGEREVSLLFPKLPVLIEDSDICREEEGNKYAAYADGIVYGLNITYKTKQKVPDSVCPKKIKFSEQNFQDRLKELKTSLKTSEETKSNQNGVETIKIKGNLFTYWLINDFNNKRWFELWASEEKENVESIKNFVESFKIEKKPQGIEIGEGSNRTLGDETTTSETVLDSKEKNINQTEEIAPLRLILKPRANYTDAARQTQVQGTVTLRVMFLGSGGIGSISPVNALPYGLTEQSIAAARKIVFIPAKKNRVRISVAKLVQYSFAIY